MLRDTGQTLTDGNKYLIWINYKEDGDQVLVNGFLKRF